MGIVVSPSSLPKGHAQKLAVDACGAETHPPLKREDQRRVDSRRVGERQRCRLRFASGPGADFQFKHVGVIAFDLEPYVAPTAWAASSMTANPCFAAIDWMASISAH